ncbi:MAG: hypothetical protein M3R36_05550 [Bacteroidota bacterium]|nr:hypothetical protein [Bacteroidota bacterium]
MSKRSKKEYLQEIYGRYKKALKDEKQKILDEFCSVDFSTISKKGFNSSVSHLKRNGNFAN